MAEIRQDIAEALEGWLTPEQLRSLLDEILEAKKTARGHCPTCRRSVNVEVADAKAVVSALAELANQGFGRPRETKTDESDRIIFERVVYLSDESDRLAAAEEKLHELGFTLDLENVPVPLH